MSGRLEGEVAVVMGGTKGIGAAIVRRFAEQGCKVAFVGRSQDSANEVLEACRGAPGEAVFEQADVNDIDRLAAVFANTVERFGKLTVLVNNTAATSAMAGLGATQDIGFEAWEDYVRQGLTGAVFAPVKYAAPHLIANGGGSIVNITSAAANRGLISPAPYAAVKGAQASLTRLWAVEYHQHKIRCNGLALAFVDTGTRTIEGIKANPELFEIYSGMQLLGMGKPDDVAYAALWLASQESRWVTGAVIPIDGGATCYLPQLRLADPRIREIRRQLPG